MDTLYKVSSGKQVNLPYVYPEMYGAVGNGVINDYPAFQQMFSGGNKVIVLRSGASYLINGNINVYSNTIVVGNGALIDAKKTPFIIGEGGDYAYLYDGSSNVELRNIRINMNNINTDHIIMAHAQNVRIIDCEFIDNNEHSIELNSSKNVTIDNCVFTSIAPNRANKEAINIDPASKGYTLNMGYFDDTISDCVKITNCLFENCWSPVGNHNPVTTYPSRNIIFAHNDVRSCYNGLHLFDYPNISIVDNKFFDIANIGVQMTGTKNVHIIGNVFDTVGALVSIEGADQNIVIAENIGNTQAETPIVIGANATNVLVHDNIINDVIVN